MINYSIYIVLWALLGSAFHQVQDDDRLIVSYYRSSATGSLPDTIDRGIGILTFKEDPGHHFEGRWDTISAYATPSAGNSPSALLIYEEKGGGWKYGVGSNDTLQPNIIEFDYERCGFPFDSVTSDSWARVVLGFNTGRSPQFAWVKLDTSLVQFEVWSSLIPKHRLFFQGTPLFYHEPEGTTVEWSVTRRDYIMHPIRTQGQWMYVRVARPSDMCVDPEIVKSDTLITWIKYLDDKGRPLVWYYSRGC